MQGPLSSLIDPADLRHLSRRSNTIGLLWLAAHLTLIAACGAVVVVLRPHHPWASVPAMAALGIALIALFTPLHETTHRTPFRSLRLNHAVGWLTGLVLVLPPAGFRLFHLAHHRHTQDPLLDPEIAGAAPPTRGRYLWLLTGLPYWRCQIALLFRTAAGRVTEPWIPAANRPEIVLQSRIFLAAYGAVALLAVLTRSAWPVWLYVVPVLFGQPVLRMVLMAEHGSLPRVPDRLVNTRTTLTGRLFSALFWHANLHAEHHLAPGVPFHALPRLHHRLRSRLGAVSDGYRAAHADIRAANRKVKFRTLI